MSSCTLIVDPDFNTRNRVSGSYTMREYSETYNTTYTYRIYVTADNSKYVQLDNFYDANVTVTGYLNGNRITINRQFVSGYEIEGTGRLEGNELHFTYSVRDTYQYHKDFCNSVARKY